MHKLQKVLVTFCTRKISAVHHMKKRKYRVIISPDESQGYIGFMSVMLLPPYVLTCVHDNSKTLSQISFKLGTHMYLGQESKFDFLPLNAL